MAARGNLGSSESAAASTAFLCWGRKPGLLRLARMLTMRKGRPVKSESDTLSGGSGRLLHPATHRGGFRRGCRATSLTSRLSRKTRQRAKARGARPDEAAAFLRVPNALSSAAALPQPRQIGAATSLPYRILGTHPWASLLRKNYDFVSVWLTGSSLVFFGGLGAGFIVLFWGSSVAGGAGGATASLPGVADLETVGLRNGLGRSLAAATFSMMPSMLRDAQIRISFWIR